MIYDIKKLKVRNNITPGRKIHGHGWITKEYKTLKPKKTMCSGCNDNYYNSGYSDTGECWSFSSAKVCDKVGHSSIYVEDGPDTIIKKTLSCWRGISK